MGAAPTPDWLERANRFALTSALLSTTVLEANNALQVISGSAQTLTAASPPQVIARRSEAIGVHARRASALLAELSSFARDETTGVARVDLAQIAHRALAMRQYTIARLKLTTSLDAAPGIPAVTANHRALLQIVLNLLVNAEQALESSINGHIAVSLRAAGNDVILAVEDNGPGVSEAALATLFTPHFTAGEDRLGIGLAVARSIAERYGGELGHSAGEGGGARFFLVMR